MLYYGEIRHGVERLFRDLIEDLAADDERRRTLAVILNTPGGSFETTEKLVLITRPLYETVQYLEWYTVRVEIDDITCYTCNTRGCVCWRFDWITKLKVN